MLHMHTTRLWLSWRFINLRSFFFFYSPFTADSDSTEQGQIQDMLTCGSCQKTFALADIVKFIQHKVLQCNKENYGQCYLQGECCPRYLIIYPWMWRFSGECLRMYRVLIGLPISWSVIVMHCRWINGRKRLRRWPTIECGQSEAINIRTNINAQANRFIVEGAHSAASQSQFLRRRCI